MGKHYSQLTETDRIKLDALYEQSHSPTDIAKQLNKDRSTIYRELGRNVTSKGYLSGKAQQKANARCQKLTRLETDQLLQSNLVSLLRKHYSPYQASVTLAKKDLDLSISHESIYQFVYSQTGHDLGLPACLPRRKKKRKPRVKNKQKKSPVPNRNSIHNRPKSIDARQEFGHWEGDLMIFPSSSANLITLRERCSRMMLAIKNSSKHADNTALNIISSFRGSLKELIHTLTLDNGGEFSMHEIIAEQLGLATYFCDPYSSWQKGSVEQGNGVVRIDLPRSFNIDSMSQYRINRLMSGINNRPMRLHDNESPADIFRKYAGNNLKGFVALQT